ncbi:bifunctional phosphopantothenoylcysteine decarboxylase/phosphopantothenate--cysteine ligase CoaBC [Coprothermobacteraceae bacterium]|nr:bifunctional phosphopantothenoylcysteine decarboxylase/phosphopantothenate--cysteine ligase CoaBC [Coprothermobacteraceae bacterium]
MLVPTRIFQRKNILLGVTGSISAYKACSLASTLTKTGAMVRTVLTASAERFIGAMSFAGLTGDAVYTDADYWSLKMRSLHIELGRWADVVVVAPATANTMAKLSHGIADNLLTAAVLGCGKPVVIAPAMNVRMLEHPATRQNIETLRSFGYIVVEPEQGYLADGESGKGRLPKEEVLLYHIGKALIPQDLAGKTVVVTAGPTREYIDDVRYISNPSSGKMGYALAQVLALRGAKVILLSGPVQLEPPVGVEVHHFESVQEVSDLMDSYLPKADAVVMAAAVGDFTVDRVPGKIRRDKELVLNLKPTIDVVGTMKKKHPSPLYVAFAAGTAQVREDAKEKLLQKGVDAIFANRIDTPETGFSTDTNAGWFITASGEEELPLQSKADLAWSLGERIACMLKRTSGISP